MSNPTYAQLNIGRNIGGKPMSDKRWQDFILRASSALSIAARGGDNDLVALVDNCEVHLGTGEWQGVAEESAHISLYNADGFYALLLEIMAGKLADMFDQDLVAVVTN